MPMTIPMSRADVERLLREYDAAPNLSRRPREGVWGDDTTDAAIRSARIDIADGDPVEAVRALRAHAARHPNPRFSLVLDELTDSRTSVDITPAHLHTLDELLGGFPGIDADVHGPRAFRKAMEAGKLDIVAHLFSRFGDSARSFTMRPAPGAAEVLDVLREKKALTTSVPEAAKAPRPRARRL